MKTRSTESRISVLELQLEEALQMLRLVALNQRTCLEVQEWLQQNYPEPTTDAETVKMLLRSCKL